MEQLELFDIELISNKVFKHRNVSHISRQNKRQSVDCNLLMEQLHPEVRKVPLIICKQPKTIKMIPCDWSEEKKEIYKQSFYDENGKFRMNPPGDFNIFGGMQTRE